MWPVTRRMSSTVADARSNAAVIETLESRRLLSATAEGAPPSEWELIGLHGEHRGTVTLVDGILHVVTTSGDDDIQIGTSGGDIYVRVLLGNLGLPPQGYSLVRDASVDRTRVRGIVVDAGAGNDTVYFFNYDGLVNLPTTINGGDGDDDLSGEYDRNNLDEPIAFREHQSSYAMMVLNGGDGNDRLEARIGDTTLIGGAGDDVFIATEREGAWGHNTVIDEPIAPSPPAPEPVPGPEPAPAPAPAEPEHEAPAPAKAVPPAAEAMAPAVPPAPTPFYAGRSADDQDAVWDAA
jgi:Ca2+-binding RTX toxin-like protein